MEQGLFDCGAIFVITHPATRSHSSDNAAMAEILTDLLLDSAQRNPQGVALMGADGGDETAMDYASLRDLVLGHAAFLHGLGVQRGDRVAVYLPKCVEAVVCCFAAGLIGAVFVPVNPLLKRRQLMHVLNHSGATVLLTHRPRLSQLDGNTNTGGLRHCVIVDWPLGEKVGAELRIPLSTCTLHRWPREPLGHVALTEALRAKNSDLAALFYTSGSTGLAKGVMISHANLLLGAQSVNSYLNMRTSDRVLAVLPLSFDYGFSQLTTAFRVGASVCLLDYLLPQDLLRHLERCRISLLAATPAIWQDLAQRDWPPAVVEHLRLICNSGGRLDAGVSRRLQQRLPHTDVVLMYGLTEAFRSTWVPPEQLAQHRDSIGIAIPRAELVVVDEQGRECADGEEGELVHGGPLVAMGYWQDEAATRQRFRAWPGQRGQDDAEPWPAVWSGDRVVREADGYLRFVGRGDAMIKSSGYRISPEEVEAVILEHPQVAQAAVFAVPHPVLGEAVAACVVFAETGVAMDALSAWLRQQLPNFMQPQLLQALDTLPVSVNHKLDRKALSRQYRQHFMPSGS